MAEPEEEYYPKTDLEDLESRVESLENADHAQYSAGAGCGTGLYSLGATLAVVISWETNHAVLWAVLHGLLSWLYVIYVLLAHGERVKLY